MVRPRLCDDRMEIISISVSPEQKQAYREFQKLHPGEFSRIFRSLLGILFESEMVIDPKTARLAILDAQTEAISSEADTLRRHLEIEKARIQGVNEAAMCNRMLMLERLKRRFEFFEDAELGYTRFKVWAIPGWQKEISDCQFKNLKEAWTWFDEAIKSEAAGDN